MDFRDEISKAVEEAADRYTSALVHARTVDLRARHQLGKDVALLERKYRSEAVRRLADRLQMSETRLYTAKAFAEKYTETEIDAFAKEPRLTFSVLSEIAKLDDPSLRKTALELLTRSKSRGARDARRVVDDMRGRLARTAGANEAAARGGGPAGLDAKRHNRGLDEEDGGAEEQDEPEEQQDDVVHEHGASADVTADVRHQLTEMAVLARTGDDIVANGDLVVALEFVSTWRALADTAAKKVGEWDEALRLRREKLCPALERIPKALPPWRGEFGTPAPKG